MPTFLECLRMAELDQVFGAQFLQLLKNSGIGGLLAIVLVVGSLATLFAGALTRTRGLLVWAFSLGLAAAPVGWINAYLRHVEASNVVAASGRTPRAEEVLGGANAMAWSVFVPMAASVVMIAVTVLAILVVRPNKQSA